jgi:leucyl aminopeptidase
MDIQLTDQPIETISTDALVFVTFDKEDPARPSLAELAATGDLPTKLYETATFHSVAGISAKRVIAIGGGKRDKFGTYELRRAAGVAVRLLKPKELASIVFVPDGVADAAAAVQASVEGAIVADFDPGRYKTEGRADTKHVGAFHVAAPVTPETSAALDRGRIIGESQNFTRDLVNEPGNYMTPTILAERAAAMAKEVGLECEILDRARCEELKMGSFLSVSLGSEEPPQFIHLRYNPEVAVTDRVLGLVGKGITFDTGGISIKPADQMDLMKYDMAGGAAMLGAMRAIALLKPPVRVQCFVPASENMPDGKAQKPGDVRIAMSGKSIEIINTDAEGRLVLADALHYARLQGCTHLIDAATLTGAIGVALGKVNVGVFTNDQAFQDRFLACTKVAGEKMWPLPMDDDYREQIKGMVADILNTGGRYGGAITAAWFLKEFVADTPWIHLDIAGTAWIDDNKAFIAKGSSGIAVRSLVSLAMGFAE